MADRGRRSEIKFEMREREGCRIERWRVLLKTAAALCCCAFLCAAGLRLFLPSLKRREHIGSRSRERERWEEREGLGSGH
jgi:hypothetical protein